MFHWELPNIMGRKRVFDRTHVFYYSSATHPFFFKFCELQVLLCLLIRVGRLEIVRKNFQGKRGMGSK